MFKKSNVACDYEKTRVNKKEDKWKRKNRKVFARFFDVDVSKISYLPIFVVN